VCLAVPARVVEVKGRKAVVEQPGVRRAVFSAVSGLKKGDFVLLQQGFAVERVSEKEAMEGWRLLDEKET
jgi:hydrogenase expression/formation protein HypC